MELSKLQQALVRLQGPATLLDIENQILHGALENVAKFLPTGVVDLLIIDPPYNLTKNYNGTVFAKQKSTAYRHWFESVLTSLLPLLTPTATVYVCSDWATSTLIFPVLESHLTVRNRITWEREKGRGAKANWKNNTEDIWFATVSDSYTFNVEAVKLKRRVLAPYTQNGKPKDWTASKNGRFRLTHPSNIWSDLTVPFWSMKENTDHPTQKPEKLLAKLILASSKEGDLVFDPFLGSGTTAVVAKKLGRRFCGVERNQEYCCWGLKRLQQADTESGIQGYANGVFWERNSLPRRK